MKWIAVLTTALCVSPQAATAFQIPLAASDEALRSVSKTSNAGGPRLSGLRVINSSRWPAPAKQPSSTLTAPISVDEPHELLNDEARGGARMGTLLGWLVGMTAGPVLFTGNDLGCNKYGECYGRLGARDAVLAGALVMGAAGFLGGTLLGAVNAPEWCSKIPLDGLDLGFSPDGKPGVKMMAEVRF